ncbi:MAG: hypothetical protein KBC84_10950 [Proteobacteria bacterium]|nr:hypothetical protein [Pseudomonadota bacterium]
MNAKKVVGFLLLRPVFNSKNFSTIGLVALFFALYLLLGGKANLNIPKLDSNSGAFGGVDAGLDLANKNPKDILGYKETEDRSKRIDELNQFGRSDLLEKSDKTPYVKKELLDIQNNKFVFDRDESRIREVENSRKSKNLNDIETRLKELREE